MSLRLLVCSLLLTSVLASGTTLANVFGDDRRVQETGDREPQRWVGQLISGREHFQTGSAVLVGECHILTAFHSAFFRRDGGLYRPGAHVVSLFLLQPDPDQPGEFHRRSIARPVLWGDFSRHSLRGQAEDWALLELDDCLGRELGFAAVAEPGAKSRTGFGDLLFAGFPQSRRGQTGVTIERSCHAWDSGPLVPIVGVDCAFERGASGGPLLERINGTWTVVGLASYRSNPVDTPLPAYHSKHRNVMVSSDAFSARVGEVLAKERSGLLKAGER